MAPMADVTDSAFRQIICDTGKPDVLYTEFVSCDGLCHVMEATPADAKAMAGKAKLMPHLQFKENERPIVAQFFGSKPENFYKCAQLAVKLGFDGIDINMGCPSGKIVKHDSGAGLIRNPELAKEIIQETKRGAPNLPVSVKTRIGYNKIITEEWIARLIEAKPSAIIVHGRTMKEMSKVHAHWDEIGKAGVLCRKAGIPIIGNGDVMTYVEGLEKAKQYDLDGIMVGRGIFYNPWFFDPSIDPTTKTPAEKIKLLIKHVELFVGLWGSEKHFDVMKKFFKIYISGPRSAGDFDPATPNDSAIVNEASWEGAKGLRIKLMGAKNSSQVEKILKGVDIS